MDRYLIQINRNNATALSEALLRQNLTISKVLLETKQGAITTFRDYIGNSYLHLAAKNDKLV